MCLQEIVEWTSVRIGESPANIKQTKQNSTKQNKTVQ